MSSGFKPVNPAKGNFTTFPLTDAEAQNVQLVQKLCLENEVVAGAKALLTSAYNREQAFINLIVTGSSSQYKAARLAESTTRYNTATSALDASGQVHLAALR